LAQEGFATAVRNYDAAIERNPNYFAFYLNTGLAKQALGENAEARVAFEKSNALLPTAVGHNPLGQYALADGDRDSAIKHFELGAQSDSPAGRTAATSLARLVLPNQPGRFIQAALVSGIGGVELRVKNHSQVSVKNIQVMVSAGYSSVFLVRVRRRVSLTSSLFGTPSAHNKRWGERCFGQHKDWLQRPH
jgi:tetratricopeptide (TPR) repeat protein